MKQTAIDVYKNSKSFDLQNFVPLHIAALSGNLEVIQWIVEKTIEKNPTDMLGTTLFHFAAYKGHFENLTNIEGLTTLHKAGTAFYLLKLKIESQGLFDQGYFLCYKYQIFAKKVQS